MLPLSYLEIGTAPFNFVSSVFHSSCLQQHVVAPEIHAPLYATLCMLDRAFICFVPCSRLFVDRYSGHKDLVVDGL